MTTRTLSLDEGGARVEDRVDHLYLALAGGRAGAGARWALDGIERVEIGRGGEQAARRAGKALRVDIVDPYMSSSHLVLERALSHWVAFDAGSRNGIVVDGAKVDRANVDDRTIVEVGRSFFVVRVGEPADPPTSSGALATLDPMLARTFDELARIAPTLVSIIIGGPTGAGKDRVARAVHALSRRTGAYVPVNCGALPTGLVESELFGHRRGAFSGAIADAPGLVLSASGGTLFLDELGDLPLPAQAALLRVLEEREVRAVGATTATAVDLRVVAATHRDLDAMIAAGTFRDDLHARLAGFELDLPPLAERTLDLGAMLADIAPGAILSAAAARALFAYSWPRNVRELVKAMERARALAGGDEIGISHLPDEIARAKLGGPPPTADARQAELVALLAKHKGNITKVADELGRVRQQVQRWIKRYRIDPDRFRD